MFRGYPSRGRQAPLCAPWSAWLAKRGNPYTLIGDDPDSRAAIALGITGAPETFIVDRHGVIRYKHIGPITPEVWESRLAPIVRELQQG